jgi:hypothetical protein
MCNIFDVIEWTPIPARHVKFEMQVENKKDLNILCCTSTLKMEAISSSEIS